MKNLKYSKQQRNMFRNILQLVFNPLYAAVLLSLVPFKTACDLFLVMLDNIDAKFADYARLLKAIATAKRQARTDLANTGFPIMAAARAYCIKNGFTTDAEQLNNTLVALRNMPFDNLLDKTKLCIDICTPLITALAPYNVDNDSIEVWTAKYNTLKDLMGSTSNAAKQRHNLGVEIETDIAAAMVFFNTQLVPLNDTLYATFPQFYTDFQSIKRIGSPNIRHTRLYAHCTTDIGVCPGITVTVNAYTDADSGKTYEAVSAITDFNGDAEVAGFFAALRTVTISGPGVIAATFPAIRFLNGKGVDHQFTLQPSFDIPAPAPQNKKVNS